MAFTTVSIDNDGCVTNAYLASQVMDLMSSLLLSALLLSILSPSPSSLLQYSFFLVAVLLKVSISLWICLRSRNPTSLLSSEVFKKGTLSLLVSILVCGAISLAYGAPAASLPTRTLLWSIYLGSMAFTPLAIASGYSISNWVALLWGSLPRRQVQNHVAMTLQATCLSTCVGAWLGAIPIPLDWDRPWQVWPISCVYGSIAGYLFGWCWGMVGLWKHFLIRKTD